MEKSDLTELYSCLVLRSRLEPGLFGRSRCEGPAPSSDSILDKIEENLNDILFVYSHIVKGFQFKKQIGTYKKNSSKEGGMLLKNI